jgi:hypothetical protein
MFNLKVKVRGARREDRWGDINRCVSLSGLSDLRDVSLSHLPSQHALFRR